MMNIEKADKKQIEEMAQIINGSTELDTVAYYRCMNIAKTIYNAGYQKLPEDSVVLSMKEWECLHTDYAKALYNVRQNAIKEKLFYFLSDRNFDLLPIIIAQDDRLHLIRLDHLHEGAERISLCHRFIVSRSSGISEERNLLAIL